MQLKLGVARNEDVSYSLNYKNNNSNLYGKNENLTCLLQTKLTEPSQETGDATGLTPAGPGRRASLWAQDTQLLGDSTRADLHPGAALQGSESPRCRPKPPAVPRTPKAMGPCPSPF